MVSSSSTKLISFLPLLLSFLVLFSLVAPSVSNPTEKLTPETLKKICYSTVDPRRCFRTLRHDPRTKILPLSQLTIAYVEKTRGKAQTTIFLLEKLTEATADADLKSRYTTCAYNYKIALADLNRAKRRLSSGSFTGVSGLVTSLVVGPAQCDDEFVDNKYVKPAELVDSNVEFTTLGSIVFALAAELVFG